MPLFKKIKEILISDFFKHSATLLSANIISQLIGFIAYPVITRLYSPAVFGEFSLFVTIAGVMMIAATGRYEWAILLPQSKKKANALFHLCHINNLAFLLLSFAVLFVFRQPIVSLLEGKDSVIAMLPLLPLFVFISALWQTLNAYLLREKKYKNISSYNIIQSSTGALAKCLLGIKAFASSGLIVGQFIGQSVATLVSIAAGRKQLKQAGRIDKPEIKTVAKEYANFPRYELPYQVINTLSANLPILLLSFYFDMAQVGILSFALAIGLTPASLFGRSMAQVLFERMSDHKRNNKRIKDEYVAFCKLCFFVVLPLFALLLLLPESFFGFLFGSRYAGVTLYFKILIPCFFMTMLNQSLSFIPDIFAKQKTAFKIEIVYVILKASSLFLGICLQSFLWAVASYAIAVVIVSAAKFLWYMGLVNQYERKEKGTRRKEQGESRL